MYNIGDYNVQLLESKLKYELISTNNCVKIIILYILFLFDIWL